MHRRRDDYRFFSLVGLVGIECGHAWFDRRWSKTGHSLLARNDRKRRFELLALPHLDAAYNLARWLAGNPTDAEDVVQDAYLRAYRYFEAYREGNFRVWLLKIVRNCFLDWVRENRSARLVFHAEPPTGDTAETEETMWGQRPRDPESMLLDSIDSATLARLMERLPTEYREVLLLREVEDLAYKEIAEVTGVPVGTVMSRLSRARLALRRLWQGSDATEAAHGACAHATHGSNAGG
jgi:RNA polymerase sigma-70 factor (ECF subfamily)